MTTAWHPATIWEALADAIGERVAVAQGPERVTWAAFDDAASRLAGTLAAAGVGHGSTVGLYLFNGPEYLIATFAAYKLRAVPVNINYRYRAAELAYLLQDAGAEALVFHGSLADRVAEANGALPACRIVVPDNSLVPPAGTLPWAEAVAREPVARCWREEADHHLLYTGGTTGLPKGVVYHLGGLVRELVTLGSPFIGAAPPGTVDELVAAARDTDADPLVALVLPPLMHGTGMSLAMIALCCGGTVVLLPDGRFDVDAALDAVEAHPVRAVALVGDAFGRPLVEALARRPASRAAFSSVRVILSSGAMLSPGVKAELLTSAPEAMVVDTLAASEAPMGASISVAGAAADTARFSLRPGVNVFDEHDRPLQPGADGIGRIGVATDNPIGYHNDPAKTAATFRVIDGVRHAFPGDWARLEPDGSITLLGRGSHCINTGGEKVFPEEVEEALKSHPAVLDALVVGVDDVTWGQRIEAVISMSGDADDTELVDHVKARLAAYKAPKMLHRVSEVPRAANGKADYVEARRLIEPSRQ